MKDGGSDASVLVLVCSGAMIERVSAHADNACLQQTYILDIFPDIKV
jgi:hypothetical protein